MNEMYGHPVEILAFERGSSLGKPMALLRIRPHPDEILESFLLLFNLEQCCRMRDSLNEF